MSAFPVSKESYRDAGYRYAPESRPWETQSECPQGLRATPP
jgi:hypothetical protein